MAKKTFYADPLQMAEIHKIFAGNPKVTIETKKTLSKMGNENITSNDTKMKGVTLGKDGLIFTSLEGRHNLNLGDEYSIIHKSLKQVEWWKEPSPKVASVNFTNSLGEKVTITLKK